MQYTEPEIVPPDEMKKPPMHRGLFVYLPLIEGYSNANSSG